MAERERNVLIGLGLAALIATAAFMGLDLKGNLAFALELRNVRLLALVTVGIAVAASTAMFQTVTANRILTPSIMGLDALHMFGQTALVFMLGALGVAGLDPGLKFFAEAALLAGMALALFSPLLRGRMDITLMLLTGVVLGILFRSLSSLLARMLDPNDFAAAHALGFASFTDVEPELLAICLLATLAACAIAWRSRHVLDVLAMGRDAAIGLGVDWRKSAFGMLALTALMVSASTALVGPIVFLGLLVTAVAERLVGTRRHAVLLPAACLTGVVTLVGGQAILQHVFGGESALGVVVELIGGVAFLALLMTERRR